MLILKIRFFEGNVNTLVEHYRKQHVLPQRICCCQEPVFTFLKWLLDIYEGLECAFTIKRRFSLRCSHALGDAESSAGHYVLQLFKHLYLPKSDG